MTLYALCLHPLLGPLEDQLKGINIGKQGEKISVLAYADDITVFITCRGDIEKVHQAIRTYERVNPGDCCRGLGDADYAFGN